jgi:16S rRNA (cytidine1402-2'-O)-methyltransferase
MGILYLVATPIGNLEDITYRAVRILREVSLIAAEDTRTARKLLARHEIHTPLVSFHEYSKRSRLEDLLRRLENEDIAVVSEAGMPGISDPGYELVVVAIERQIDIVPVPGPSALVAAVAASGLPRRSFLFLGFLPNRAGARRRALQLVASEAHTLVFYESPHRLLDVFKDMREVLGDRRITVARELTKLHEEIWRGILSEALAHFEESGPRGEFTLVVAGAPADIPLERWSAEAVQRALAECRHEGLSLREAAAKVSAMAGRTRREVYRLGVQRNDAET